MSTYDYKTIKEHIETIHNLADGINGKLTLANFTENKKPEVKHFNIGDVQAMTDQAQIWCEEEKNVYTPLTVMREDLHKGKKGSEQDCIAVLGYVLDFDDGKGSDYINRLPKNIQEPQYVLETSEGNAQCFYLFEKPIAINNDQDLLNAKTTLKHLTEASGGADLSGIDLSKVWRIAGTLNVPSKSKIKRGRSKTPQLVKVKQAFSKPLTNYENLKGGLQNLNFNNHDILLSNERNTKAIGDASLIGDIEMIKEALFHIPNTPDNQKSPATDYATFIKFVHAIKSALGGNEQHYGIYYEWCSQWPDNSDKLIREKWDSIKNSSIGAEFIFREAEKLGWINPETPKCIKRFNTEHFVSFSGGKTRVYREVKDKGTGQLIKLQEQSTKDFKDLHLNKLFFNKDNKRFSEAEYWLKHPKRRTFEGGVVFSPNKPVNKDQYNLWRGFPIEAKDAPYHHINTLIMDVFCDGDEEVYDYVMNWLAFTIQNVGKKTGVAIIITGAKGVGKGLFAQFLAAIFGNYYVYVTNPKHLIGNFNAHLKTGLLLVADEAFFAGNKKDINALKPLITEETIAIEAKGKDVENATNHLNIIMLSNEHQVVNTSGRDERRFLILNVGVNQKKGREFYSNLVKELHNGGPEGLLKALYERNLDNFDPRLIPQTRALLDQKIASLDEFDNWLYEILQSSMISSLNRWSDRNCIISTNAFYDSYLYFIQMYSRKTRPIPKSVFCKKIKNFFEINSNLSVKNRRLSNEGGDRINHLELPNIYDARKAFDYYIGQDIEWQQINFDEVTDLEIDMMFEE